MKRTVCGLACAVLLAGAAPPAVGASDPTEQYRWHMPRRGARKPGQEVTGPPHAEWNRFGHLVNDGKDKLGDWGLRFDVDLDFFDPYASRVVAGQQNFATFSWRVMGDWRLLDLGKTKHVSAIGKGFVGWTPFGTVGLNYDSAQAGRVQLRF